MYDTLTLAAVVGFALNGVIHVYRRREKLGWWPDVLALLAVLSASATLAQSVLDELESPLTLPLLWMSSAALSLLAIAFWVIERRYLQRTWAQSYGLLMLGLALVLLITSFSSIPLTQAILPPPTDTTLGPLLTDSELLPIVEIGNPPTLTPAPSASPTATLTPSPTLPPTLVPSATPTLMATSPLPNPTATPAMASGTPSNITPQVGADEDSNACQATTLANLNLRREANTEARILITIPTGETVTVLTRVSGEWWQVRYGDQEGWAFREFLQLTSECQ